MLVASPAFRERRGRPCSATGTLVPRSSNQPASFNAVASRPWSAINPPRSSSTPTARTRGRRSGSHIACAPLRPIAPVPATVRHAAVISVVAAAGHEPRKQSVTCSALAGRTRNPVMSAAATRPQAPSASATSAGNSSATNSLRGAVSVTFAAQQARKQVQRGRRRAVAHVAACTGQPRRPGQPTTATLGDAEADRSHRLVLAGTLGSRDSCDADSELGAEHRDRSGRESLRNLGRDGSMLGDEFRRNAEQGALGSVAIGDDATRKERRGAGTIGEPRGHQPARARFAHGDCVDHRAR